MGAGQAKNIQESVAQLSQANISPANEEFWKRFYSPSLAQLDLITHVTTKELLKIRQNNTKNFAVLVVQLVARLRRVLTDKNTPNDLQEVMNAIRLLTRLLPVAFEGSVNDSLEENLFWKNTIPGQANDTQAPSSPAAEPSQKEGEDPIIPAPVSSAEPEPSPFQKSFDSVLKSNKPIGRQLLDSLMSLLFFPGLTTVSFTETAEERAKLADIPLKYAWAPGVGVDQTAPYNSAGYLDSNRREILMCLLSATSYSIYIPTNMAETAAKNRWLEELVSRRRASTNVLLYSMINVIIRYDPVGWGVPYNHALFFDVPEQLMNTSVQLLNAMIEHRSSEANASAPQPAVVASASSYFSTSNLFAVALSELSSTQEFDAVFKGIVRLLTNHVTATKTYLPGATKQITCHQEILAFFWQLIQVNRKFLDYILRRDEFVDVLFPIFHLIHEGRKDPAQLGLVHLGIFVILFLSGERDFSIVLNRVLSKKLLIDLPKFTGNYADYLILVFIKVFIDGHKRLESLWECMLTIIANISPYIKALSLVTSMRLLKLFGSLSRRTFLLQRERNHRYVFFLLEAFNNLLQYQYEGNTFLVYAVISQRAFFFKLLELAKNPASALVETTPSETTQAQASIASSQTLPASIDPSPVAEGAAKVQHTTAAPVEHSASAEPKFTPTMEWLGTWVPRLPLGTIVRFLNGIMPSIDSIVDGTASDQDKIVDYLRKTTLVGILPVPHPILIRHYAPNKQTQSWFNHFLWGVVYIRNSTETHVLKDTTPQLFLIRTPEEDAKVSQ